MANLRKYSAKYVNQSVCTIFGCVLNTPNHAYNKNFDLRPQMRTFSRTTQVAKSRDFYSDLGISRTATQSEIKNAYYNLSMIYHPDKNKGTEEAVKKFRIISEAYEVLGNFRTRRLYDKGIGSFVKGQSYSPGTESEMVEVEVEDDAQTKFYKQHMVKSQAPMATAQSTAAARDFDNWYSARTKECFESKQESRRRQRDEAEDLKLTNSYGTQLRFVYVIFFTIFGMGYLYKSKKNNEFELRLKKYREKNS